MGRGKSNEGGEPISIRISPELRAKIDEAAKGLQLSVHDTMRKSMKLGLAYYRSIGYDEESVLLAQAGPKNLLAMGASLSEEPAEYGKAKRKA